MLSLFRASTRRINFVCVKMKSRVLKRCACYRVKQAGNATLYLSNKGKFSFKKQIKDKFTPIFQSINIKNIDGFFHSSLIKEK